MATKLQVTELDFDDIKNNLKTYMRNQEEFKDYNFEGSALSTIIDLLSYNTHYLAMNANLAVNESFLDTATLRSSVVSHAKTLGYTPRSARAPVAYLDITINANASVIPSVTMAKGTKFTTQVDGTTYSFVTNTALTTTPSNGILRFSNVPIYEGTLVTTKYTVDVANPDKKYLLTSNRADTTTLKVSVQTSAVDVTTETYTLATDITQVNATTRAFFLQENDDGKFEVYFGDGVVGKKPSDGNIVILEYVVTNKDKANGASSFSGTTVGGYSDITIATLVSALGGAEPETIQSIKYNAPLDFASQGRAVTTDDYKLLVPQVYADTKSVQVWGGEDNNPPVYGQVYVALQTNSGITLTQAQKDTIARSLDRYNIASVRPIFVDPQLLKLRLTTNFKYDANVTSKSVGDLESLIRTSLSNYSDADLEKFDGIFRFSKVTKLIDDTDPSILSNITTVKIQKSLTATLNTATKYVIDFTNALYHPHAGHNAMMGGITETTGFTIVGNSNTMYLNDDGNGTLRMYYLVGGTTRTYVNENVGTIDYNTGVLTINSLNVASTVSSNNTIEFILLPKSNDVVAVRNQLLEIDLANTTITGAVDTITSGGSSAGTNYTTSSSY
jgi:hypothetical protein